MASFSFRGNAIGQNATTIVIDDVNDMNTAKQMAEARYPGWSITQGTKMGGSGTHIPTPRAREDYKVDYTQSRVNHSSQSDNSSSYSSSDNSFDNFIIGGTLWLGGKMISMTWNFTTDVLRVLLRWSLITFRNLVLLTAKTVVMVSNVTQNACVYCENKLNENWHF